MTVPSFDPHLRSDSFKDAVATIRRTSVEHQFQLVITRAYDEGEEQLLDEDAECQSSRLASAHTPYLEHIR